jgi:transcriptional regulator with XRE-family HTH domain
MSSTIVDDEGARLACRLRAARLAHDWSLSELAERSGVSRAMVHKVESGQSSPTAALLGRLGAALGLTPSQLLSEPLQADRPHLLRRAERRPWRDPETGLMREQIVPPCAGGTGVEIVRVPLGPGQSVAYPAEAFAMVSQVVWVSSGRLVFEEGEMRHELGPDDSLRLGPPAPCTFRNEASEPCVYVVALHRMR